MEKTKHIALVAHDTCKRDLVGWVEAHWEEISKHKLICTGTTGRLVEEALTKKAQEQVGLALDITDADAGGDGGGARARPRPRPGRPPPSLTQRTGDRRPREPGRRASASCSLIPRSAP